MLGLEVVILAGEKDLITAQALAQNLDLSVETIWRYTRERKIPFIELGNRQYRYKLADVINSLATEVVREKGSVYKRDNHGATKKYTYQDYLEIPHEPGYRFEILEGELIREPSPNVPHQRASRRLQRILEDYFWEADPAGEIFNAPLDVTPENTTVVQPDLFYVSGEQKKIVEFARVNGSPALVVEILSPSTSRKDRFKKMQIYQRLQVKHYWLVNPEEKTLECFSLHDGLYALVASGMDEDVVEHREFPNLTIDLNALWT